MKESTSKIGLLFGSFNPIHIGHLIIANYMVEFTDLDEVWFVVSPHNPLKEKKTLLADHHRLAMARIAVEEDARFRICDIEFKMEQPSYTIRTLTYLTEKYPGKQFVLIAGTDVLPTFNKWKNYEQILENYYLYIYPRPGIMPGQLISHPHITLVDAPLMDISSSFIRNAVGQGKNVEYMLPQRVWQYLREMHFYEK